MRRGHEAFDVSDVQRVPPREQDLRDECEWLRRQCRALLTQRSRAFQLGYQTALEEMRACG